jgi:D-glycero-alpha-D-manno-heptose-7-phosphate kinase
MIKERVGCQDQYAAACGGINYIAFNTNGKIELSPIVMDKNRFDEFRNSFLIFYTGITRIAHEILDEQVKKTSQNSQKLKQISTLVTEAIDVLTDSKPLEEFGRLLDQGWILKKKLSSKVSNDSIDQIYSKARNAGAIGGKLMGAGGGGFILLFVPPDARDSVRKVLNPLKEVKFDFENEGSRIIFYNPEEI